jgi:hypothetical protein
VTRTFGLLWRFVCVSVVLVLVYDIRKSPANGGEVERLSDGSPSGDRFGLGTVDC